MKLAPRLHRKWWEWAFIAQAFAERNSLGKGSRGLGFAVGQEPLSALFAARGCSLVSTDLDSDRPEAGDWGQTNEHAATLDDLNRSGICPPDEFRERVRFRPVDMTAVPDDLTGFDFCWSSCSLEHLGSIRAGLRFIVDSTRCLRAGGTAVHTTEYNVSSNDRTLTYKSAVIFRRRDFLFLTSVLAGLGHQVEPWDFSAGRTLADGYVAQLGGEEIQGEPHLKYQLAGHVTTSVGMIVTAGPAASTSAHRRALRRIALYSLRDRVRGVASLARHSPVGQ